MPAAGLPFPRSLGGATLQEALVKKKNTEDVDEQTDVKGQELDAFRLNYPIYSDRWSPEEWLPFPSPNLIAL